MYICIGFIFNKYSCFDDFVKSCNPFLLHKFSKIKFFKKELEKEGGCGKIKNSA